MVCYEMTFQSWHNLCAIASLGGMAYINGNSVPIYLLSLSSLLLLSYERTAPNCIVLVRKPHTYPQCAFLLFFFLSYFGGLCACDCRYRYVQCGFCALRILLKTL